MSIATGSCEVRAPRNNPDQEGSGGFTVVRVNEITEAEDPIQWVLIATESIATLNDVMELIENYRLRWWIEDWHKVLKTGCKIEQRQLQTSERMEVLLRVPSVIALKILELGELARGDDPTPADILLVGAERTVLGMLLPELPGESAKAYAVHGATLGG